MRKILLFFMLFQAATVGWCCAGGFETSLMVSNTSLIGNLHYKQQMMNGYWKTGASGVYSDQDDLEYKWLALDLIVGNDLLRPGLIIEAGFQGVLGDAEKKTQSGDIGAVAFKGKVGYLFSPTVTFIPIEIYGTITYAPEILSFRDNKNYFSYNTGVGFHIVDNASIFVSYNVYDVEMESGPGGWDMYDNQFRFGLRIGF